jgi:hypothetical protein
MEKEIQAREINPGLRIPSAMHGYSDGEVRRLHRDDHGVRLECGARAMGTTKRSGKVVSDRQ